IHTYFALGPTVRMLHAGGSLRVIVQTLMPIIEPLANHGPLVSFEFAHTLNALAYTLYKRMPDIVALVFKLVLSMAFGPSGGSGQAPVTHVDSVLCATLPSGMGGPQTLHWAQMMNNENLQAFDYGLEKNLRVYGKPKAPLYDLGRVKLDKAIVMVVGQNDILTSPKDYNWLKKKLKVKLYREIFVKGHNHGDLVIGKDCDKHVVNPIVAILIERTTTKVTPAHPVIKSHEHNLDDHHKSTTHVNNHEQSIPSHVHHNHRPMSTSSNNNDQQHMAHVIKATAPHAHQSNDLQQLASYHDLANEMTIIQHDANQHKVINSHDNKAKQKLKMY
ncbi:Gastric triacylglycerol lipase, partial [Fragariocoptes setiger]